MTLKEAYEKGTKTLEQNGIAEASLDAWYLLEYVTGISRAAYFLDSKKVLDASQESQYLGLLEKRAGRIPLQHLTGVQEFMGLEFLVNEDVLIPRQDTETLAETALELLKREMQPVSLLDMCTGSGCILLSILKLLPDHFFSGKRKTRLADSTASLPAAAPAAFPIWGMGVDISGKALEMAERNAKKLGIEAEFCQSNLFEHVEGKFSMIVSNPPYIRTSEIPALQEEVRAHDPLMALDGGEDGLYFYRRIIRDGRKYLEPGGYLIFEIGHDQASEVIGLMQEAGFQRLHVKKDLAGLERVVSGMYGDRFD